MSRTTLIARSLFLLGFVIAMPLLALPSVARWADDFLYGDAPGDDQEPALVVESSSAEHDRQVAQAVLEMPLAPSGLPASEAEERRGLDAAVAHPPVMPPTPQFPEVAADVAPAADRGASIPDRVGEIRQRLEDLGADYIRLEADSETGPYHFRCLMLVAPGAVETKTFEASGNEATAVAEQVLRAVEAWRASLPARSPVQ